MSAVRRSREVRGGQSACAGWSYGGRFRAQVRPRGGRQDLRISVLGMLGVVHPDKAGPFTEIIIRGQVWRNNAMQVGDSLILTKPSGDHRGCKMFQI